MTPREFRQEQNLEFDHFQELTSTGIKPNYVNIEMFAHEYYKAKLKLLGIGVVIERFSIGQLVKWGGMKFWVAEDNGDSKVLVCNCEDTKNIQQSEYNDWWVDRDVLNAL